MARGSSEVENDHAFSLAGEEWGIWRDALLRSAGFPAEGLTLFSSPGCARAADDYLRLDERRDEFDRAFADAIARNSAAIYQLAADPLFREAVIWQNMSALIALDRLHAAGPAPLRDAKHRARERMIARYWQRYCGKVDTVGFFGPICWVMLDPAEPSVTARPGAGLLRNRSVRFEYWPLAAFAGRLAGEPPVRASLAPGLSPQLTLAGRDVIDPVRPPLRLTSAEAGLVSRCDGRTPAWRIAEQAVAEPASGLHSAADVYLMLANLVTRGILRWDFDLPVSFDAERVLRERVRQIADDDARASAEARLDLLSAHRARVASSAGDPDKLAQALSGLAEVFTELAGEQATRRPGEMYAGRTLCVEDTARDLDVTFGRAVIDAISAPLALLLTMARWLCCELAEAYLAEFGRLHAELGPGDVPLGLLWFAAQHLFYGTGQRPADRVVAELARRWDRLFGLQAAAPGQRALDFSSAALGARLAECFPRGAASAWGAASIHSVDLHFGAPSAESFASGTFSVVLGEIHAAWTAACCEVTVAEHRDPAALRRATLSDFAAEPVYLLLPLDWPRRTARLAPGLETADDVQLAFTAAPGADPRRLVRISSLVVRRTATGLVASAADGRRWPLTEIFGRLLSELAVEAFKFAGARPHTPRITVDRLVLARESWRMSVADCPVTTASGERAQYLAARSWKAARGLPDHAFVKLATEVKPMFVDLTSPVYVSMFAAALRAALRDQGACAGLAVTEMLPGPDQAWIPDADGRRYLGELRLHARDAAMRADTRGAA